MSLYNNPPKNEFLIPENSSLDLTKKIKFGTLFYSPFSLGCSALLKAEGIQNHAPQLCWLSHKDLACVWMSGGQEGTSGMSIFMSILKSGSKSWAKPRCISQDQERSEQNPLLFILPNEKIALIHTSQRAREPEDSTWKEGESSFSMQWTAKLILRTRNLRGSHWTKSKALISTNAFCRHPPFNRDDGTWLLPIYRSLEEGGGFGHDHSEVLVLNENGSSQDFFINIPSSKGRVHGSIVLSSDGKTLLQFFRSRLADNVYRSFGSLNGEEWTIPEPIDLPNNNSSMQALRLKTGRLAIIFNRFSLYADSQDQQKWGDANWPRTRWPLSIALSEDNGDTWPWMRDIDSGLGFCGLANWHLNDQLAYPSIIEGNSGELHIAYSWGSRTAIRYMCIHENDIIGPLWT